MYVKWTGWFPRIRRWFSRGELARRILKVPRIPGQSEADGLIHIQIDGLSKSELELAIADGRVPFSKRLLKRERYCLHTMYSGGQEATTPYEQKFGKGIQEAIEGAISEVQHVDFKISSEAVRHPGIDRSRWIGEGRIARALFDRTPQHAGEATDFPSVVANGPIGLVYLSHDASEEEIRKLARAIVDGTGCPIVLTARADGKAIAHGWSGEYVLPEQASCVLGVGHPFLREAAEDLVRLVQHPDSGDLVLSGWNPKGESLSFALQHGAHGGPGAAETNAFVLTPPDTQLEAKGANVLRPSDLRNAGLAHLCERRSFSISKTTETSNTDFSPRFRILTYNVHSCIGMDNRLPTRTLVATGPPLDFGTSIRATVRR